MNIIEQCDKCELHECINCEHSWSDIQEIKQKLAEKDKEVLLLKQVLDNLKGDKASDKLVNAVNAVYEPLLQNKFDEIERLKKELADWKDGTIIVKYEKQLAEKDKEIKHLNKCLSKRGLSEVDFYKRLREKEDEIEKLNKKILDWQDGSMALKIEKETRHQVCEEIRELAGDYFEFPICENCGESLFASSDVILTGSDLTEILDQIEQGE